VNVKVGEGISVAVFVGVVGSVGRGEISVAVAVSVKVAVSVESGVESVAVGVAVVVGIGVLVATGVLVGTLGTDSFCPTLMRTEDPRQFAFCNCPTLTR